jgi:dihydrofolate reductase
MMIYSQSFEKFCEKLIDEVSITRIPLILGSGILLFKYLSE